MPCTKEDGRQKPFAAVTMTVWKPGCPLSMLLQVPLGSRMTCRCSYRKWCRRLTASLSDCPLQGRGVYIGQLGGDEWLTKGEGQMFLLARAQPLAGPLVGQLIGETDRQTQRERKRERDRQTDRERDRQTEKQGETGREMDRQTDRGGGGVCLHFFFFNERRKEFRCIFHPLKTDSSDTPTICLILRPYLGEHGLYACGEQSLWGSDRNGFVPLYCQHTWSEMLACQRSAVNEFIAYNYRFSLLKQKMVTLPQSEGWLPHNYISLLEVRQ